MLSTRGSPAPGKVRYQSARKKSKGSDLPGTQIEASRHSASALGSVRTYRNLLEISKSSSALSSSKVVGGVVEACEGGVGTAAGRLRAPSERSNRVSAHRDLLPPRKDSARVGGSRAHGGREEEIPPRGCSRVGRLRRYNELTRESTRGGRQRLSLRLAHPVPDIVGRGERARDID